MRTAKRALLWLLTSAIPVVIAACYGTGYNLKTKLGRVLSAADKKPIEGIQVNCILNRLVRSPEDGGPVAEDAGSPSEDAGFGAEDAGFSLPPGTDFSAYTGSDGEFVFSYDSMQPCDSIRFVDVDGVDNGRFDDLEAVFIESDEEEIFEMTPSPGE